MAARQYLSGRSHRSAEAANPRAMLSAHVSAPPVERRLATTPRLWRKRDSPRLARALVTIMISLKPFGGRWWNSPDLRSSERLRLHVLLEKWTGMPKSKPPYPDQFRRVALAPSGRA